MRLFEVQKKALFANRIKNIFSAKNLKDMEDYVKSVDPDAYYTSFNKEYGVETLKVSREAGFQVIRDAKAGVIPAQHYVFYCSIGRLMAQHRNYLNQAFDANGVRVWGKDAQKEMMDNYLDTAYAAVIHQLKYFDPEKYTYEKYAGQNVIDLFVYSLGRVLTDYAKMEKEFSASAGLNYDGMRTSSEDKQRFSKRDDDGKIIGRGYNIRQNAPVSSWEEAGEDEGDEHSAADSKFDKMQMDAMHGDYNPVESAFERDGWNSKAWAACAKDPRWLANDKIRASQFKTIVNDLLLQKDMGERDYLKRHPVTGKRQSYRNYNGGNPQYHGDTIPGILEDYGFTVQDVFKAVMNQDTGVRIDPNLDRDDPESSAIEGSVLDKLPGSILTEALKAAISKMVRIQESRRFSYKPIARRIH